jgi:hypothetical protein
LKSKDGEKVPHRNVGERKKMNNHLDGLSALRLNGDRNLPDDHFSNTVNNSKYLSTASTALALSSFTWGFETPRLRFLMQR